MQNSDVKLSSAGKRGRWKRRKKRREGWRPERVGAELEVLTTQHRARDQVKYSNCVLDHNEIQWKGLGQDSIPKK